MKKIIIAMAAIAAAFTMASCNKEQPASPNENPTVGKSVITASIENDHTKVCLDGNDADGYKVVWSQEDEIFVGGGVDEYGNILDWIAVYKLEGSSACSSKGIFSWQKGYLFKPNDFTYQEPVFEEGKQYVALYDICDIKVKCIWNTVQTNSTADRYIPMFASTECTKDSEAEFIFSNLGGLLRLTVKGTATIQSIRVHASEPMSGEVDRLAIDKEGHMSALMVDDDMYVTYNFIELDCGENGVSLNSTGTDFYISMPCHYVVDGDDITLAGYSDVTITLTDTEGKVCEKKLKSNNLVIERSKITTASFTASEFKPFTSINGHECVRLGRYYWATENVGACSETPVAGPETPNNSWGYYYYQLNDNNASNAAKSWGSEGHHKWTLPNALQWEDLANNCYWEWSYSYNYLTSPHNGKPGFIVYKAKNENDKGEYNKENSGYSPTTDSHIFLPAAGECNDFLSEVGGQGGRGSYCSSDDFCFLDFWDNARRFRWNEFPYSGMSVRPVSE